MRIAVYAGTFDPVTRGHLSVIQTAAAVFDRLLKNRVVMLGSDVNDDIANQICAQLLYLEGEDPNQDIWLYINSPGGSVTAGMAIYDTMRFMSSDVATYCMGRAYSGGSVLLTAGTPGKRFMLPHAKVMIHQPYGGVQGTAADIEIEADELEARMFQHEIDHLNGVLMFDRLEGDQRKSALAEYRRIEEQAAAGRDAEERGGIMRRLRLS